MPSHQAIAAAFAVLGLPTEATFQQVKEAFRDLAQVWHPDRFTHNPRLSAQAEVKMKEMTHAYSVLRDYLEGNRQESASGSKRANHWQSSEESEKNADQTVYSDKPAGPQGFRDEDERVTRLKCPHCGQKRRVRLSAEWIVLPLTVRCRKCGKGFTPVPLSDDESHIAETPTESSRRSPVRKEKKPQGWLREWWQDPILRWALIFPAVVLVLFVSYLAREWHLARYRNRIVYLSLEARDFAADNQNRDAYGKYLELLAFAGNNDPATLETRGAVETARTELDRLYPLVRGQLDFEKAEAQVQFRENLERIGVYLVIALGVGSLLVLIIFTAKADAERRALSTKCPLCQKLSALHRIGENIVSQTPRPKTVTRMSSGAAFLDGQFIPSFRSDRVQIIVYDIVFRNIYWCRFCHEESTSQPMHREVQP